ncbi:putative peroxin pex23-like-penicillium chrysogenum [Phaeomoniella chlamydospora]|uniref:Putative peroxin pex23-like-penicillium chrysogenum n=1 Tax=Phaeomoniella chlamydospora TaxID=158046 RepID=A0A0G2E665_PHACM|nr:putative peroxin pex23-like-penicillium chrysogenum [Phaeomoniella chlamydospora]
MSASDGATSRQTPHVSETGDAPIKLVDATVTAELSDADNETLERLDTKDPRWRDIARRVPTRTSVREGLARRKWAKWQAGRVSSQEGSPAPSRDSPIAAEDDTPENAQPQKVVTHPQVEGTDFAGGSADARGRPETGPEGEAGDIQGKTNLPKPYKKKQHKEVSEFDILYENQRGSFMCGIPLYSHSSLLNFDPSPWVTRDLKDSPVNITNAQVPDPTWEWAWKTWYVDMTGDVDEEGWQYSFSFSSKFSWHGTHPWFHSFVRRRRWLRKRTKKHHLLGTDAKPSSMSQAHILTSEYFTIHPKRDRSRSTDRYTGRSSYISTNASLAEPDLSPEEIQDIPSLRRALKFAAVDREKIDAVRRFVSQGGPELTYLKDSIPEIMSFLVFQNSRRQLLSFLKQAAADASKHREEHHFSQDKPEGKEEQKRIDNILAAVEAANKQIDGLEYWSDRKHVLRTSDEDVKQQRPDTAKDLRVSKESNMARKQNPMADDDIKGIPDEAAVGYDPTEKILQRPSATSDDDVETGDGRNEKNEEDVKIDVDEGDKPKREDVGKEEEGEDEPDHEETPVSLPTDAMRVG